MICTTEDSGCVQCIGGGKEKSFEKKKMLRTEKTYLLNVTTKKVSGCSLEAASLKGHSLMYTTEKDRSTATRFPLGLGIGIIFLVNGKKGNLPVNFFSR